MINLLPQMSMMYIILETDMDSLLLQASERLAMN
jgi:hypothetical protein